MLKLQACPADGSANSHFRSTYLPRLPDGPGTAYSTLGKYGKHKVIEAFEQPFSDLSTNHMICHIYSVIQFLDEWGHIACASFPAAGVLMYMWHMSTSMKAVVRIHQMDASAAGDLDKPPTPPPVIHKAPAASLEPVLGWATTSTASSTAFSLRFIQDQEAAAGAPPGGRPTHETIQRLAAYAMYTRAYISHGLVESCLCSDGAP